MIGRIARKSLVNGIDNLIVFLKSWIIYFPAGFFYKRKKNLWLFIGRDDGRFLDNVKYLYLYVENLKNNKIDYYFITQNKNIFNTLKENRIRAIYHPTHESFRLLLSCEKIIIDSDQWIDKYKYQLCWGAEKIQLWHGSGIKRIELDNPKSKPYRKWRFLTGRFFKYDLLTASSEFFAKNYFKPAFNYKKMVVTGFPRNDVFYNYKENYLINTDKKTLDKCITEKGKGKKIILIAPTFRDTGGDPVTDGAINIQKLKRFAELNRLIFVFKFHPHPKFNYLINQCSNILFYDNDKDVYPFMSICNLLITDYSSIYIDFLLTGKPVLFFCYDYEKYVGKDRGMKFDYEYIACGPKTRNQEEMESEILKLLKNNGYFKKERKEILDISFDFQDGKSSERIYNIILKRGI